MRHYPRPCRRMHDLRCVVMAEVEREQSAPHMRESAALRTNPRKPRTVIHAGLCPDREHDDGGIPYALPNLEGVYDPAPGLEFDQIMERRAYVTQPPVGESHEHNLWNLNTQTTSPLPNCLGSVRKSARETNLKMLILIRFVRFCGARKIRPRISDLKVNG